MPRPPKNPLIVIGQPRAKPTPADSPRNRFVRVAPDRVSRAVKAVRHLQQFGNPAVYDVRVSDAEKVLRILREEIDQLEYVLKNPGKTAPILTFDDEE